VAVIAGHVDSKTGPAVFYRLHGLRAGAEVFVDRADGTTATFVVDRLAEFAKADFPDREVYHSGSGAQLRLITCGGTFNHGTGHYVDNVVVFAGERPPATTRRGAVTPAPVVEHPAVGHRPVRSGRLVRGGHPTPRPPQTPPDDRRARHGDGFYEIAVQPGKCP
jgi:hypothetical protein